MKKKILVFLLCFFLFATNAFAEENNKVTLTLNMKDSMINQGETSIQTITLEQGTKYKLPNIHKNGFVIAHWSDSNVYPDAVGTHAYAVNTFYTVQHDTTLYAVWQDDSSDLESEIIYISGKENSLDNPYKHLKAIGEYIIELKPTPENSYDGMVFDSWKKQTIIGGDGRFIHYKQGQKISLIGSGMFLIAHWRAPLPTDRTITIDPDSGFIEATVNDVDVAFDRLYEEVLTNGNIIVLPNSPTRSGYTFDYWLVDGEKTNTNTIIVGDSDINITAMWKPQDTFGDSSDSGNDDSDSPTVNNKQPNNTTKPDTTNPTNTVNKNNINQTFSDIQPEDWYSEYVAYVYNNGMMNGTDSGKFEPNAKTTRGMIVTMLYRLEGELNAGNANFSDVSSGQWFTDAVAWAAANGIVNGYTDGTFAPNNTITREELAAILYRYAETKGYDITSKENINIFSDSGNVSEWAKDYMEWAISKKLLEGDNGCLRSQDNATRAEVAKILTRFCQTAK